MVYDPVLGILMGSDCTFVLKLVAAPSGAREAISTPASTSSPVIIGETGTRWEFVAHDPTRNVAYVMSDENAEIFEVDLTNGDRVILSK